MKKLAIFALLSAGALFSQQTLADANGAGWYAGGGLGWARVKDTIDLSSTTSVERDGNNLGGKLFVGYRINEYFGVEGAYSNYGKEKYRFVESGDPISGKFNAEAMTIAATGRLPIGNGFAALGKIGVSRVHAKYTAAWTDSGVPKSASGSHNTVVPTLGFGAEYALSKSITVRAEYEINGKANIVEPSDDSSAKLKTDMLSVGLSYHF